MISLRYDVNTFLLNYQLIIHLTSYGIRQYRSYTDFDIKMDGSIRILAWTFD